MMDWNTAASIVTVIGLPLTLLSLYKAWIWRGERPRLELHFEVVVRTKDILIKAVIVNPSTHPMTCTCVGYTDGHTDIILLPNMKAEIGPCSNKEWPWAFMPTSTTDMADRTKSLQLANSIWVEDGARKRWPMPWPAMQKFQLQLGAVIQGGDGGGDGPRPRTPVTPVKKAWVRSNLFDD